MKIYCEKSLRHFEFWSGAKDRADVLTLDELDQIEMILEDLYPEGVSETDVNDLVWFEYDLIAEWLGFDNWEQLEEDHNNN